MKAEEVLDKNIRKVFEPGITDDFNDTIQAMREYARIQIEKDRKAVIENAPLHKRLDIIYAQHNTPINLEL